MSTNTLVTVSRRRGFASSKPAPFMQPVPTSSMVLQNIAEAMAKLNQKVDALANRPPQQVVHSVELPAAHAEPAPSKKTKARQVRTNKVNRRYLLDIFD